MATEVWTVTAYQTEFDELVRLGDKLVPNRVAVTMRAGDDALPGRRRPDARFSFELRDGAAICSEISIVSHSTDRRITTADLVLLDLDVLARQAFDHWATDAEDGSTLGDAAGDPGTERRLRTLVRRGYGDPVAELREVARVYLDPDHRGKPTERVTALMYGSRETASRRIKAARAHGLIPAPKAPDDELDAAYARLTERQDDGEEG